MDAVALWCGYIIMVSAATLVVLAVVWFILALLDEIIRKAVRVARESYWWARWVRFEHMVQHKKGRK